MLRSVTKSYLFGSRICVCNSSISHTQLFFGSCSHRISNTHRQHSRNASAHINGAHLRAHACMLPNKRRAHTNAALFLSLKIVVHLKYKSALSAHTNNTYSFVFVQNIECVHTHRHGPTCTSSHSSHHYLLLIAYFICWTCFVSLFVFFWIYGREAEKEEKTHSKFKVCTIWFILAFCCCCSAFVVLVDLFHL